MIYPTFNPDPLFLHFRAIHTAIRRRISNTNPTRMLIATPTPAFSPPASPFVFEVIFEAGVDFAVGLCEGREGNGEVGVLPLTVEFLGGEGGEM
ncbi:hypothetical protein LguiB_019539 [Lonicera macranthoides]